MFLFQMVGFIYCKILWELSIFTNPFCTFFGIMLIFGNINFGVLGIQLPVSTKEKHCSFLILYYFPRLFTLLLVGGSMYPIDSAEVHESCPGYHDTVCVVVRAFSFYYVDIIMFLVFAKCHSFVILLSEFDVIGLYCSLNLEMILFFVLFGCYSLM